MYFDKFVIIIDRYGTRIYVQYSYLCTVLVSMYACLSLTMTYSWILSALSNKVGHFSIVYRQQSKSSATGGRDQHESNTYTWDFPDVVKFRVAVHMISEKAILFRHPDYNPDRAQKLTSSSISRHLSTRKFHPNSCTRF